MKKRLFSYISLFLFTGLLILSSCSKDDGPNPPPNPDPDDDQELVKDTPGNISGMGKSTSTPGGKAFSLPEGIELTGSILGDDAELEKNSISAKKSVKNDESEYKVDTIVGSGTFAVYFNLKNTTDEDIEVEFPAKYLMKSESAEFQNLILLKKTTITVPANEVYGTRMLMYGVNNVRENPSADVIYKWGVTSNSSTISDLCVLFKEKKINCSEYDMSVSSNRTSYQKMVMTINDRVVKLTDEGYELDESDLELIKKLPDVK